MKTFLPSFRPIAVGIMLGSLFALGTYTLLLIYLPIEHFTTLQHHSKERASAFTQWKLKDQEYRHRYFYRGLALGCLSLLSAAAAPNTLLTLTLLSGGLFIIGCALYIYWNYITLLEFLAALIIIILTFLLTAYLVSYYTSLSMERVKRGLSLFSELILGICLAALITMAILLFARITSLGSPLLYTCLGALSIIAATFLPQDFLAAGFFLIGTMIIVHQGFFYTQHSGTLFLLVIMVLTLVILTYYAYCESKKERKSNEMRSIQS